MNMYQLKRLITVHCTTFCGSEAYDLVSLLFDIVILIITLSYSYTFCNIMLKLFSENNKLSMQRFFQSFKVLSVRVDTTLCRDVKL